MHGIGLMGGTITVVALPPPAAAMAVSKTPNLTQVSPPGAMVIFTIHRHGRILYVQFHRPGQRFCPEQPHQHRDRSAYGSPAFRP